ncbi:MAG TPA: chorismate-binding protein [Acidimicrobiales bacterium]|nr:chorismate-binding protein [Acidimicrobiales bacterium]
MHGGVVRPSREEFASLAKDWTIVPVWQELLADMTTPVAAYARLVRDEPGFVLESVEHAGTWGRWSFIGRRPSATMTLRDGKVAVEGSLPPGVPLDRGILAAIEAVLSYYKAPPLPGLPPFHGGVVGYLGYDVVREVEKLTAAPPDELSYPDAVVSVVGQIAAYDAWRQRVTLVEAVPVPQEASSAEVLELYDQALHRLEDFAAEGAKPIEEPVIQPPERDDELPAVARRTSAELYASAVEVAREYIYAGDIFQVVLAQRFDLELGAEPLDLYRSLRQVNPSPYMYLLQYPELAVVGSSPEPMVRVRDGLVISRPIAGTRRRGHTEADDRRLAAELSEHPKERAEHVMLVDLARNDVGRVVEFGSETIDELMTLERYSHVMHLTSQVSGRLRPGLGPVDVLRATLPAGTVSGAPKVRAMEIIDELEPARRGPYAGVVGYIDFSGNVDTAIAIRTMLVGADGRASVEAGAGIVADSIAETEDLECRNKAAALLAAVPGARRIAAARGGLANSRDGDGGRSGGGGRGRDGPGSERPATEPMVPGQPVTGRSP